MPLSTAYKERQRRYLMVALAGAEFERHIPLSLKGEYARGRWKVSVLTPSGTTMETAFDLRWQAVDWAIRVMDLEDTIT